MRNSICLGIIFLIACSPKEKPIHYGLDDCEYCKMIIMDQRYGSELVTSKGKVYTFDALECMLHYLSENENTEFAFQLTNSYDSPKNLAPTETCYYLISEKLPSPMGANLTAFVDLSTAQELQTQKSGQLLDWNQLKKHFSIEDETE